MRLGGALCVDTDLLTVTSFGVCLGGPCLDCAAALALVQDPDANAPLSPLPHLEGPQYQQPWQHPHRLPKPWAILKSWPQIGHRDGLMGPLCRGLSRGCLIGIWVRVGKEISTVIVSVIAMAALGKGSI